MHTNLTFSLFTEFLESLKDFDKTPSASSAAETSVDATSTKSSDEAPDPLDEALSAEVARKAAEELDQAMNMLAGENPDVFRRLEEFAQGFEASLLEQKGKSEGEESPVAGAAGAEGGGEGGGSVQDKMKKTLEQMQKDAKDIKVRMYRSWGLRLANSWSFISLPFVFKIFYTITVCVFLI